MELPLGDGVQLPVERGEELVRRGAVASIGVTDELGDRGGQSRSSSSAEWKMAWRNNIRARGAGVKARQAERMSQLSAN
jgi:hypothetical protein